MPAVSKSGSLNILEPGVYSDCFTFTLTFLLGINLILVIVKYDIGCYGCDIIIKITIKIVHRLAFPGETDNVLD
jgi:hypothetical protein